MQGHLRLLSLGCYSTGWSFPWKFTIPLLTLSRLGEIVEQLELKSNKSSGIQSGSIG